MAAPSVAPSLEATQIQLLANNLLEEIRVLNHKIDIQNTVIEELRTQLIEVQEFTAKQIMEDRKRLRAIEEKPKEAIYKTEAHLSRLQAYLAKPNHHGVTFSTAAKVLGLSRGRISQMSEVIRGDKRFKIIKHPTRSNTWVITLSNESANVKRVSSMLTPQEDM